MKLVLFLYQHILKISFFLSLQTDDKGVFLTTLSKEFAIAMKTFRVSASDVCNLTEIAIEASFATSEEKLLLLHKLKAFKVNEDLE